MGESLLKIIVAALVLVSISILYVLYVASGFSLIIRVVFALMILVAVGIAIQKLLKLNGGYGFYMIGGRKGLSTMDNMSKNHKKFWNLTWMWGLTIGFGLLAYPLMKGKIDKKAYAFGIISLVVIILLVEPYIATATQFIKFTAPSNRGRFSFVGVAELCHVTTAPSRSRLGIGALRIGRMDQCGLIGAGRSVCMDQCQ